MIRGQLFEEVLSHVHSRADRSLPDEIVRMSDLRMDADGRLSAPETPAWVLNSWSRRQLATLLGIRWDRWFEAASPGERADEVNRRLSRMPGEKKLRSAKDAQGQADGVLRAFLSPAFTPIDDIRVFDRLDATQRGEMGEYEFTGIEDTESSSQYRAVRREGMSLRGDEVHPGWHLRNSEVGGAPLTLDDLWLRLACSNGLLVQIGGKRLLYRTHRMMDDDHLAATLVVSLSRLPERWQAGAALLEAAQTRAVEEPDVEVGRALSGGGIPKPLLEAAQTAALSAAERTRYAVVQAITATAHSTNKDPEVRFRMEHLAGEYLLAA